MIAEAPVDSNGFAGVLSLLCLVNDNGGSTPGDVDITVRVAAYNGGAAPSGGTRQTSNESSAVVASVLPGNSGGMTRGRYVPAILSSWGSFVYTDWQHRGALQYLSGTQYVGGPHDIATLQHILFELDETSISYPITLAVEMKFSSVPDLDVLIIGGGIISRTLDE